MNPVTVMLVGDISNSIAPLASFLTWSNVYRLLDSFCMEGLKRSMGLFEGRSCQNRMLLLPMFAVAILITLSYAKAVLAIFTLFRLWVLFLLIPLQIPEKDKKSRWFHPRYSVDLLSPCDSVSSCWRGSPSFSASRSELAGCFSNFVMSKNSISRFSPWEYGPTVPQRQQKKLANDWLGTHNLLPLVAMWFSILKGQGGCTTVLIIIILLM